MSRRAVRCGMDRATERLIEHYDLRPLPIEGTLFTGTYRSPDDAPDGRPAGTAMIGMYAHDPSSRSMFHRLPTDEVWHFYGGDPIRLILLHPDGTSDDVWLGTDIEAGHRVQFVVRAGTWQAGELGPDGTYGLFGCTMAPGFTSAGFEAGISSALIASHPDRRADIERLGVPEGEPATMPEGFAT
jgi:predicted cupin superfamily sugar epimerase